LFYTNRQWKYLISTGGCVKITASGNRFPLAVSKPGPPGFFYWRAVTETASDNLLVPQALSSFLLVCARADRPAVRQGTLASCQAAYRPPLRREHRRWFLLSDWRPKKVSTQGDLSKYGRARTNTFIVFHIST
jgi:hypothetical protein